MKKKFKLLLVLATVLMGTAIAWYCNGRSLIGIDDANIYFVYMKNLAHGEGFVFNVGDERVEGFTSLLWALIGGFYFYISSSPEILLLITNIVLVTYSLWKLVCFTDNFFCPDSDTIITPYSLFLLGALIAVPGYFDWTVLSLLETGLWSSLLILLSLNLLSFNPDKNRKKSDLIFSTLIVLLILCRPESILWGTFFVFIRFIILYLKNNSLSKSIFSILPSVLVLIISAGSLILWRKFYFGYPFPNTYYAKVSPDIIDNIQHGFIYLGIACLFYPLIFISFIVSLVSLYRIVKQKTIKNNIPFLICMSIMFITLFIPLYTGGDHFGCSRFIQPTMPLLALGFILSILVLNLKFNYICSFILILIYSANFFTYNIYENILNQKTRIKVEWDIATFYRKEAYQINEFFQELNSYPTMGLVAVGGNSFAYKGKTIDLMGLNNVEMAHAKKDTLMNVYKAHAAFNKDVFFKQLPDLFLLGGGIVDNKTINHKDCKMGIGPRRFIFKNVQLDDRFGQTYVPVLISNKKYNYSLKIYVTKSFLKTLDDYKNYTYKIIPYKIVEEDYPII